MRPQLGLKQNNSQGQGQTRNGKGNPQIHLNYVKRRSISSKWEWNIKIAMVRYPVIYTGKKLASQTMQHWPRCEDTKNLGIGEMWSVLGQTDGVQTPPLTQSSCCQTRYPQGIVTHTSPEEPRSPRSIYHSRKGEAVMAQQSRTEQAALWLPAGSGHPAGPDRRLAGEERERSGHLSLPEKFSSCRTAHHSQLETSLDCCGLDLQSWAIHSHLPMLAGPSWVFAFS